MELYLIVSWALQVLLLLFHFLRHLFCLYVIVFHSCCFCFSALNIQCSNCETFIYIILKSYFVEEIVPSLKQILVDKQTEVCIHHVIYISVYYWNSILDILYCPVYISYSLGPCKKQILSSSFVNISWLILLSYLFSTQLCVDLFKKSHCQMPNAYCCSFGKCNIYFIQLSKQFF